CTGAVEDVAVDAVRVLRVARIDVAARPAGGGDVGEIPVYQRPVVGADALSGGQPVDRIDLVGVHHRAAVIGEVVDAGEGRGGEVRTPRCTSPAAFRARARAPTTRMQTSVSS